MSIKPTDRWRAPSRGTPEQAIATFTRWGSFPIGQVGRFTRKLNGLCAIGGLDFSLLISHSALESGDRKRGLAFLDSNWATEDKEDSTVNRYQPGGMGVTDWEDLGYGNPDGEAAAYAFFGHHARYEIPPSDPVWDHPEMQKAARADQRWNDVPKANIGTVKTIAAMTGKWWTNPTGHTDLCARGNQIFPAIPDQHADPIFTIPEKEHPVIDDATKTAADAIKAAQKPYILIVAGHRSDGDAGDPTEKRLTQFLAEDYTKAFRAAGFEADWWQRDLDKDSQPTMTTGGLDTVALGCGKALAARKDALSIMLDLHYNGPSSPVHVIVPDTTGLVTAYSGGAPSNDTAANNTLDVAVAQAIAQGIVAATGMSIYRGRLGNPGVMSERDTGVGIDGYRLAMFAATTGSRAKAIRLVVEHGGYNDPAARKDTFSSTCAAAAVSAVITSLNLAVGGSTTPEKPVPPTVPKPVYVSKVSRPWLEPVVKGEKPYVLSPDGVYWFSVRQTYRTLEAADRDQKALSNSPDLAEQVQKGTTFVTSAVGTNSEKLPWVYTPWGSMIDMRKLAVVHDQDIPA